MAPWHAPRLMRRWLSSTLLGVGLLCAAGFVGGVVAQDRPGQPRATSGAARAHATAGTAHRGGKVHVDPTTGARFRLERPSGGLERGMWPVPGLVVIAVGSVLVVATLLVLVVRARRRRG